MPFGRIRNKAAQDGFTLVEMAVVTLIAGLVIAAAVAILVPMVSLSRKIETEEKLAKISEYLNAFAAQNYRLPCPAEGNSGGTAGGEPYGFEAGSGANGDLIPTPTCPLTEGIVPFRTLGVAEDLAVDAWDQYITYVINPNFAQDTATGNPALVHPACRTRDWMFDAGIDGLGERVFRNRNPRKARFCCPDLSAGLDLIINDEGLNLGDQSDDQFALSVDRSLVANAPADGYQAPDNLMAPIDPVTNLPVADNAINYFELPQVPPANQRATAVAYALVSHGRNRLGAFLPTAGARLNLPPAGSIELENTDGDNVFIDQQTFSENFALFDDVVLWRTQDLIMAAEGESCAMP